MVDDSTNNSKVSQSGVSNSQSAGGKVPAKETKKVETKTEPKKTITVEEFEAIRNSALKLASEDVKLFGENRHYHRVKKSKDGKIITSYTSMTDVEYKEERSQYYTDIMVGMYCTIINEGEE